MVLISTLEDAFEIALERNRELTSLFDRLNGMSLPFNDQSFKNSDSDRITKLEKEVYSLKKSID